ncbi:RNA polymerase sigma factor [Saccharicrinis sp. FJH62]|uniref:RNA polymerase sigma factor n=1 Tax=Saccharicrinis sp. FJH62 TaxID=3344657 RepID=UPI0035D487EA
MLNILKNTENNDSFFVDSYRESGDSAFLGQLFDRYIHLVYGLCLKYLKNREDSQDATMEIYEKVANELRKSEVKHFKSWLYIVSRNHCLSILKKKQQLSEVELISEKSYSEIVEFEDFFTHINKDDFEKNKEGQLYKCIENLKEFQKDSITLFYFKEKCYKEIADILNTSIKKVKSYLQNGKRNLKRCLEINEEAA